MFACELDSEGRVSLDVRFGFKFGGKFDLGLGLGLGLGFGLRFGPRCLIIFFDAS